jgi:hypothetical protein
MLAIQAEIDEDLRDVFHEEVFEITDLSELVVIIKESSL